MARSNRILHIRTTKANLDAQAAASGLFAGELYAITDQGGRTAVATAVNSYVMTQTRGVSGFCSGKPTASEVVMGGVSPYIFNITQGNCSARALVAATASTVFQVRRTRSGTTVNICTLTFAAAGTLATAGAVTNGDIVVGDLITIVGPATPDETLADISFLIRE